MLNNRIRLFGYYGGKLRFLDDLEMLVGEHENMYEIFSGSAVFTLNHSCSGKLMLNEKNKDIYHIWKIMKDEYLSKLFIENLQNVEYSKERFLQAKNAQNNKFKNMNNVDKAIEVFVLITQSYNSAMQFFSDNGDKDERERNRRYIERNIYNAIMVHEKLKDVEISNMDAIKFLKTIAWGINDFIYADPPYLHNYRGKGADKVYGCEMSDEKHKDFLEAIRDVQAKCMISGYRAKDGSAELYDSILRKNSKWQCYLLKDIHRPNKGGERAKEYIWVNYDLPSYANCCISMEDVMKPKKEDKEIA